MAARRTGSAPRLARIVRVNSTVDETSPLVLRTAHLSGVAQATRDESKQRLLTR
jgi:hypothetical protein